MLPNDKSRCLGQYSFTVNQKPIFASCQHKHSCKRYLHRNDYSRSTPFSQMLCKDDSYKFFMEVENACDRSS